MKPESSSGRCRTPAFTLIELLVVISIIGVLAALLFPVGRSVRRKQVYSIAQSELEQVAAAIEAYKIKTGFYPPDHPGNAISNQLFFELKGTVFNPTNNVYTTLDGTESISTTDAGNLFGTGGFANSSRTAQGTDEKAAPVNFLKNIRQTQIGHLVYGGTLLVCSVEWADPNTPPVLNGPGLPQAAPVLNPWRYVSSGPTNNPNSYDLWVDLRVGSDSYRVSNWSKQPQPL
jgi:prepilin-type N-terminal cleavage/methylation domain-containing protein